MEYLPLLVPLILLLSIPVMIIMATCSSEIKTLKNKLFTRPTELDRQIAEEEKEIKFLTVQKEKIDHLESLKRKKDRLYQGVEKDAQRDDMGGYRCKQCGGTKVTGIHFYFYDRRLGQHIPVNHCSDCGTLTKEMERVK